MTEQGDTGRQEALAEDQLAEVSACRRRQANREPRRVCIQGVVQLYDRMDAPGGRFAARAPMTVRVDSRQRQAMDWLRPFGTQVQNPLGDVPTVVFVFMAARKIPDRFLVAFSLAGEQRDLVRSIADAVEGMLGRQTVFLDEWYEHYLAGADADLKLQDIYGSRCDLAVVCISKRYGGKPWTLAEHEAIRARLMLARASDDPRAREGILPIRVGDGEVPDIPFNTIIPDVRERAPRETAQLIVDRLRMLLPDLAFPAEGVTYSGDRITLDFNDIEVRAILQLLFDFAGLNLVMSDIVRGNMPLRLKNVPWDQVLDIVLGAKGLGMRQTGRESSKSLLVVSR